VGAFGKPEGAVARAYTGQVIAHPYQAADKKEHVIEALHRAKFKFPGHQRSTSQRSGALPSLMQMDLKTWY
jgi:ribosomal protein L16/L10AE